MSELRPGRLARLTREARRPFEPGAPFHRLAHAQAQLGLLGLDHLAERNATRRRNAERLLFELDGVDGVVLPELATRCTPTFHALAIRVHDALAVARALLRRGVDVRLDYMDWLGPRPDDALEVLYLPNHPALRARDVDHIAASLRAAVDGAA